MKNLLNPKWLIFTNTLPLLLLFSIFLSEFQVIKHFLDEDGWSLWLKFSVSLFIFFFLNFVFALYLLQKQKKVPVFYGLALLAVFIPYLYLYGYYSELLLLPFEIPRWMLHEGLVLYPGTFLMPTLAYGFLIVVVHFAQERKKIWPDIIAATIIPIAWYVFALILFPLWGRVGGEFGLHTILVFTIVGTLLFLFFLTRGAYLLINSRKNFLQQYRLLWLVIIAVILPLIGLGVNNGIFFHGYYFSNSSPFGDFRDPWFYILAAANGIVLCLPNWKNPSYRFALFAARCITFIYTFYFFLVFLPFLPLSVIAIVLLGLGFLMLTPLILFIVHTQILVADFQYLGKHFKRLGLYLIMLGCFLCLPFSITMNYLGQRNSLHNALDYVYNNNYDKDYAINTQKLEKVVDKIVYNKDGFNGFGLTGYTPYLSAWYNFIVLDNLSLSNSKIEKLQSVFALQRSTRRPAATRQVGHDLVDITSIQTESRYDAKQDAWSSWVHLEITNTSKYSEREYASTIKLPNACWISDYYLYVGERKEHGMLTEKKTAMWIYNQIRYRTRRDPGLLHYLSGNEVLFRVFPFTKGETRKTGIQFLHKEPIQLELNGQFVSLGNKEEQPVIAPQTDPSLGVIYISSEGKKQLPKVKRQAYFHFLVDVSKDKEERTEDYIKRIENLLAKETRVPAGKISFVNTYTKTIDWSNDWKNKFETLEYEGGFYVEHAIKKNLIKAYQSPSSNYPIFIVLTDHISNTIIEKNFKDFQCTFPENELFYHLNFNNELTAYSLLDQPKRALADSLYRFQFEQEVLAWPNAETPKAYLPADSSASIVYLEDRNNQAKDYVYQARAWESGLMQQGLWQAQLFHPERSEREWRNLLKASFQTSILTPVSSYIVLETEAQKATLLKKQQQVLAGKKEFDLEDDVRSMSEPELIVLIVLFGLFWLSRKRRKLST